MESDKSLSSEPALSPASPTQGCSPPPLPRSHPPPTGPSFCGKWSPANLDSQHLGHLDFFSNRCGKGEIFQTFFHLALVLPKHLALPKPSVLSVQTLPKAKQISEGCGEMNRNVNSDDSRFQPQLHQLRCDFGPYFLVTKWTSKVIITAELTKRTSVKSLIC